MPKILSCDPGITSGFAMYDLLGQYSMWELDTRSMLSTWRWLALCDPDEIVHEDFKHRPNMMKAELHSLKVIALLELYAEKKGSQVKDKYLPAYAKKFWTDDKIKKLGLWQPGKGHAMDALRVLLTYQGKQDSAWYAGVLERLKPNDGV